MSLDVAIIGRTQMLYDAALALHTAGHRIRAVVTAPAAPEYTKREGDFESLARELDAEFVLTKSLDDERALAVLRGLDLGVSMNWVSIVGQRHLDAFRLGILNTHAGDLPRYRGNACPNWAILDGASEIVLSVHFMEADELDTGRVVVQATCPLSEETTVFEVYQWFEREAPQAMARAVARIDENPDSCLKVASAGDAAAFRCYPRLPVDGFLDWNQPAVDVHRLVRASGPPFAGAYTFYKHRGRVEKLRVLSSRLLADSSPDRAVPGHVLDNDPESGESRVACGRGIIALCECRHDGDDEAFQPGRLWKSIRMRLGLRPEDWLWDMTQAMEMRQRSP